jgi:hypothetical protein
MRYMSEDLRALLAGCSKIEESKMNSASGAARCEGEARVAQLSGKWDSGEAGRWTSKYQIKKLQGCAQSRRKRRDSQESRRSGRRLRGAGESLDGGRQGIKVF